MILKSKYKRCLIFTIVAALIISIIGIISIKTTYSFDNLKKEREAIVQMIANGDISVPIDGQIELPKNMKKLSSGGKCRLVKVEGKTGIYFYTYRSFFKSSKGYVFTTDKINIDDYLTYYPTDDFESIRKIEDNWYSCSANNF